MSSSDRFRQARTPRLSPAFVIAVIALFVSLGGGAYAAKSFISASQIRDGSITGKKIQDRSLSVTDLSVAARAALRGAQGIQGVPGAQGLRGPAGPAAHTPFEVEDVEMAPDAVPRTVTTQGGTAIVMTCSSVTAVGWAWGVSANVTATTDIGSFTLVNGLANQLLTNGTPDPDQIYPYDFTGSFLEFWKTDGTIVRTYGHLEVTEEGCHLSESRGVVYA